MTNIIDKTSSMFAQDERNRFFSYEENFDFGWSSHLWTSYMNIPKLWILYLRVQNSNRHTMVSMYTKQCTAWKLSKLNLWQFLYWQILSLSHYLPPAVIVCERVSYMKVNSVQSFFIGFSQNNQYSRMQIDIKYKSNLAALRSDSTWYSETIRVIVSVAL